MKKYQIVPGYKQDYYLDMQTSVSVLQAIL